MAILNNLISDLKTNAKLSASVYVVHKIDKEQAAEYVMEYAKKQYGKQYKKFIEEFYMGLLEFVSAINRRRR